MTPTDPQARLVEFLEAEAAEERKQQRSRIDSAATWRIGTDATWKEAARLNRTMGHRGPVPSAVERRANAEIEERIAVKHAAKAEQFEQAAALLREGAAPQELEDDHYIPERDGRRCVAHPKADHELICLTCLEGSSRGLNPEGVAEAPPPPERPEDTKREKA